MAGEMCIRDRGYRVAVLYHSTAKAAAELEKQLSGITAVQCDVASRASCELAFLSLIHI